MSYPTQEEYEAACAAWVEARDKFADIAARRVFGIIKEHMPEARGIRFGVNHDDGMSWPYLDGVYPRFPIESDCEQIVLPSSLDLDDLNYLIADMWPNSEDIAEALYVDLPLEEK